MSKALDFLLKTKPEAMGAYFQFLKASGKHLDKKTAALISIITKVHSRTANGLRQYLPRALKEGASAHEILDALLFAMPALGFSKIVWAVDVILEMDLPEFHALLTPTTETSQEISLGRVDQFQVGKTVFRQQKKQAFFVTRTASESVMVLEAICPHQRTPLGESCLNGNRITCPMHEWIFSASSGENTNGHNRSMRQYATEIVAGNLILKNP